jgi:4'-phosphopantetheinyl transferase EntD
VSAPRGGHPDRDPWWSTGAADPAPSSDIVERVAAALASMAPAGVRTGARRIDEADLDLLRPGERAAVSRAVSRRRAEFATGRALLRELIGDDVEIPVGPDRRPILPRGVSGTLAHDVEVAVAATTSRPEYRALGVDIEPLTAFDEATAEMVRRPEERHLDAHLVFVLKEAAYKAWSSGGGGFLEHRDVRVEVDTSGTFHAEVVPAAKGLVGRYVLVADRHLALVVGERDG